jgi:hypothetical protein
MLTITITFKFDLFQYFNKMRRKTKLNLHRVKSRRSKCGYADMTRELLQLVAKDDVNARKTLLPQKKFINTKISNKSAHLCMTPSRTNKRKLTPLKSPIKTPFKSPIYKARAIGKRCPSSLSWCTMSNVSTSPTRDFFLSGIRFFKSIERWLIW